MNGLCGVCTYIHENSTTFAVVNSSSFLMLASIIEILVLLCVYFAKFRNLNLKSTCVLQKKCILYAMAYAACNNFGNLLSMAAMKHLPASVHSALGSGFTLFISLIISILRHDKVSRKNVIATFVALIATILFAL